MWNRKILKINGRRTVKKNYWRLVILCLLMAFVVGEYSGTLSAVRGYDETYVPVGEVGFILRTKSNSSIVAELVNGFNLGNMGKPGQYGVNSRGVLAFFVNHINNSGSVVFGILNALNQFLFKDQVMAGVIILISVLFSFIIWCLVNNVLIIGECRIFLEVRRYYKTPVNRLLFLYRIHRVFNVAWVMLCKWIFTILWSLTIVGAFIKPYSYRMIPYILAENPEIKCKEAFALSKQMMHGQKWKAFKLDVSFLLWWILGMATLGIVSVLYVNPYRAAVNAELYMVLRKIAKELKAPLPRGRRESIPYVGLLNDGFLDVEGEYELYPEEQFFPQETHQRRWMLADYHRKYTLRSYILLFFTFAFIGWVWEVSLILFTDGVFVNRGVLHGPWLPIYGTGGVRVLFLLKRFADKPLLTFFLTVAVCGCVEYYTAWYLEMTKGIKWWDYSGYFMNLNGRICLEGLLVFGLGGCAFIYWFAPMLDDLYKKIPRRIQVALCIILLAVFVPDNIYSHKHPNAGEGITSYTSRQPIPIEQAAAGDEEVTLLEMRILYDFRVSRAL